MALPSFMELHRVIVSRSLYDQVTDFLQNCKSQEFNSVKKQPLWLSEVHECLSGMEETGLAMLYICVNFTVMSPENLTGYVRGFWYVGPDFDSSKGEELATLCKNEYEEFKKILDLDI